MVIKINNTCFFKMLQPGGFTMAKTYEKAQQFASREDAEKTVELIHRENPGVLCEIV